MRVRQSHGRAQGRQGCIVQMVVICGRRRQMDRERRRRVSVIVFFFFKLYIHCTIITAKMLKYVSRYIC